MEKKKQKATEIEFLKFFYQNSDFGPADADVKDLIKENFICKTGKELPDGYSLSGEDDD